MVPCAQIRPDLLGMTRTVLSWVVPMKASAERNTGAAALCHSTHPTPWPASSMHWERRNLKNVFGLCILEKLKTELTRPMKKIFGAYKVLVYQIWTS